MKDYKGLKKNMLTAIEFSHRINNKTFWVFKCDCGSLKNINPSNVLSDKPSYYSCGCKKYNKRDINNSSKIKISIDRTKKDLFYRYRKTAVKRGYSFEITYDFFISNTDKNCHYCNSKPNREHKFKQKEIIFPSYFCNGIDRKDNNKGYTEENCLPCCTICNRAKNNLNYNVFMNWIQLLKNN
jgi:hypothetical protein